MSDWSSDVCSSDLLPFNWERIGQGMTRAARIFSGAIPPSFTRHELLIDGFLESMQIAILSTLLGLALSVPIAFMAARNIAAKPIYLLGRTLIILARSFHRSEEHTSELPSLMRISYAVFCLKKNK